VRPAERTAVMGITSMVRTLAATAGPTITGILAGNDRFWIAFVAAGALRLAYDFGLWALFVNMKLHKHEQARDGTRVADPRRESDEEELQEVGKA
jgi:MFS family permease